MAKHMRMMVAAAAALVVCGSATVLAQTAAQQCQGFKNDALGKYAACRQKAEQRRASKPEDTAKYDAMISKCAAKLAAAWQKAEERTATKSATCPDAPRTEAEFKTVIDTHSGDIATALASGSLPLCPGESPPCAVPSGLGSGAAQVKCQAAKNALAGKYAQCRQKAEQTRAVKPDYAAKYADMISKCEAKFATAWQKLEAKVGAKATVCRDAPLTFDLFKRLIDMHSGDVAAGLASATLREHCGGACVEVTTPPVAVSGTGASAGTEFCQTPCSVEPSVTPHCGACAAVCGLGESCVNGSCRCLEGAPTCRPTRPVPLCPVIGRGGEITTGCWFLEGVDLEDVTIEHRIVEVTAAVNADTWIHVDGRSLFPSGTTSFPIIMECQSGRGELSYPNNKVQANYFGDNGVILDEAALNSVTTTTRACKTWEDGPVIPLFSTADFPRGHLIKFRPETDASGHAYQVMTVVFVGQPEGNTTLYAVDYVINVLADACAPITVTATAQAPLSVVPSGAASLVYGTTAAYVVTSAAPVGGIVVGGTCPRGTWSGSTYTISEPLTAGCSVDFRPPS